MESAALISLLLSLVTLAVLIGVLLLLQQRNPFFWKTARSSTATHDQLRYKLYARVLENCDDVAWLFDLESRRLLYITPSVERMRGWTVAELLEMPEQEFFPKTELEKLHAMLVRLKARPPGEPSSSPALHLELDMPLKQGGTIPVETECKLINDNSGKPTLLLGISRDITQRRRLEKSQRESEERMRLALYCSGDSIWDLDWQSRTMNFFDGWEELLGYGNNELKPTLDGYLEVIHIDDRAKVLGEIERHLNGAVPAYQCEFRIRTKGSGWRWVLGRGRLWSRTTEGKPLRMIGTHTDITSRKVAEVAMSRANVKLHTQIDEIRTLQAQLAEQAIRDPLTGLYNRRFLNETLEREIARARREGHPLAVVMLDVDLFKNLNDSYGHQAGDEVLKALSDMLREDTRAEDVACRYGGEEFLVLLPSMPLEKACVRAEHWRTQLENHVFVFGNFPLSVTASFGVSAYPFHGKTPDELTYAADVALYNAKRNGRNRVEVFDEAPIVFFAGSPPAAS